MAKRAAQQTRRERRGVERLLDNTNFLMQLAAESLGFSEDHLAQIDTPGFAIGDMVEARVFEFLEHIHGCLAEHCIAKRAEMEARNGAGFIARVAATGTPAAAALSSHKIHFGELLARLSAVLDNASKWRNGGLLQRCTAGARRRVRSGPRRAPASWRVRASASRSSFGSRERRSTLARSSARGSRNMPSDAPAAPWSVPRVAEAFVPSWLL